MNGFVLPCFDQECSTSSSSSVQNRDRPDTIGKSTVIVQPSVGNDSGASLPAPKRLNTFSPDLCGECAIRSTIRRSAASSPIGTTNWYCRKPFEP